MAADAELRQTHYLVDRVMFGGAYLDLLLRDLRKSDDWSPSREARIKGIVESLHLITKILEKYLRKPLAKHPPDVQIALIVGAYQLLYETRTPDYAAVNGAVSVTKSWAKKIVNGVLRNIGRERESLEAWQLDQAVALQMSLPQLWGDQILQVLPEDEVDAALRALRQPLPLHIVPLGNQGLHPDDLTNITTQPGPAPNVFSIVEGQSRFFDSDAYLDGRLLVQDHGIYAWLQHCVEPTGKVWDPFCAPGGKLLHLATTGQIELFGSDRSSRRLGLVEEALRRAKLSHVQLQTADALQPPWQSDQRFDLILADVPCTASGTIMRHPEIGFRLQREDVKRLQATQTELLQGLAQWVSSQGKLWYSTCSLFPAENEEVVQGFLMRNPDWSVVEVRHPFDDSVVETLRFWPHRHQVAGFTATLLKKH